MRHLYLIILLFGFKLSAQVKIPVVKVYNHTLTGNELALIDNQNSNVQVSGSSDQSIQPTGANSWFNDIPNYLSNPVLITQDNGFTGAFRTTALPPEGINFTLRFNGIYKITKVCIFVEPQNNGDKGHIIVRSGTPYNFTQTLVDLHDNGSIGPAQWYDASVDDTSRYINLSITDPNCGRIREIIFYGNLLGSADNAADYTIPNTPPVSSNKKVANHIGMNIFYGMGMDFNGTKYDEGYSGGTRIFGAVKYVMTNTGQLLHSSGTANSGEASFIQRLVNTNSNPHYCYGSLVTHEMAENPVLDSSDWATQKPIPISLGNIATGQRYAGKLTFNEIATIPSSYAYAANNLRLLAEGNLSVGIKSIEPDNEKDGSFKQAGFMYPEQQACMMSVYWDGHNSTVTHNGNVVGIRNYPGLNDVSVLSPAFSYISERYWDCMILYWQTFRTGFPKGIYPFDTLSVHSYAGTFETQANGTGEAVHPERTDIYNMPLKLAIARNYAAYMGKGVINTESGYDTYNLVAQHPETGCTQAWGGSFAAIRDTLNNPPFARQAQWTVRNFLLHIGNNMPLQMYWLSDQARKNYGCGTFNAAGLLEWDDNHGIGVNTYLKKPSWYWVKTLQNRLGNYSFYSQTISGEYVKQLYVDNADTSKKAYVVWLKVKKDSSLMQNISIPSGTGYKVINFNNTETGSEITGTGNIDIAVTQSPAIILFQGGVVTQPGGSKKRRNFIIMGKRFINI